MKYIISNKGYLYKINKSGKKRISRDEYLKNNKQKGGGGMTSKELLAAGIVAGAGALAATRACKGNNCSVNNIPIPNKPFNNVLNEQINDRKINHSNLSNGKFNNNHFEMLFGRNFDITRINGRPSQEEVDNYFEENFGITSEETIDEMLTYYFDDKIGFSVLEEFECIGWFVDKGYLPPNSVLQFFETPIQKQKLVKFLKKKKSRDEFSICRYKYGGILDRAISKSLVSTVLPNTNNINKSCYIKLEGTNNRNNILIPKNIVNHSILLKEMIKNNNSNIPVVEIPSNINMTVEQLKSAMDMIVRFYSDVKQRFNSINAKNINKQLVIHLGDIIQLNKNNMINILKLTNYLQFISLLQNIFIGFRILIQENQVLFLFDIIDIIYKSNSVNLPEFNEIINMFFPTFENKKMLDNIFNEFNSENKKLKNFISLKRKILARQQ